MTPIWLLLVSMLVADTKGTTEHVRSELVLWPVIPNARCTDADPENLLVAEDGRLAEVIDISPETRPVVHTLLVDDSKSVMLWRRHLAKAVRRYIAAAPEQDTLIVRHMSETDPLVFPPGGNTAAVEAQLRRIQDSDPSPLTPLRDSLLTTVRSLTEREQRNVLVVVTDGLDTASRGSSSVSAILEAASGIPDLSVHVFLIHDGRPKLQQDQQMLFDLAHRTGGLYLRPENRPESRASAGMFMRRLRSRLRKELIVAYKPPPRLEQEAEEALREVEIDWVGSPLCHMESARPLERRLKPRSGVGRAAETSSDSEEPPSDQ